MISLNEALLWVWKCEAMRNAYERRSQPRPVKTLLEKYATSSFRNSNGSLNQKTIVAHTTEVLAENGLKNADEIQQVGGVWIYPADYFNTLDSLTGKLKLTENTRSIHWYMNSWSDSSLFRQWLSRTSHRFLVCNCIN